MLLPVCELIASADDILRQHPFVRIHFHWDCAFCDAKQSFQEHNTLYKQGICEECGGITTICEGGFDISLN